MTDSGGEEFRRAIRNARHESVTPDLLGKESGGFLNERLNDGALIAHLDFQEQPHFILRGYTEIPDVYGAISPNEFYRSRRYRVFHVITDQRWLCVVGNKNGDQTLSIPLEEIKAANYRESEEFSPLLSPGTTRWEFSIETESGFVQIPINDDITEKDLSKLGSYLESEADVEIGDIPVDSDEAGYTIDGIEAYNPSEKTVANLIDNVPPHATEKADRLVAEADNAGDLVRELKTLIEETDSANHSIDDVVAEANGTTELREHVASRSDKVRSISSHGIEEVKTTLKESDPQEVGEFTLHATQAAAPAIKYARRTNLALLTMLAISSAAGARKSSNQPSLFDDIDPKELSAAANAMALRGAEMHDDEVKGEAIGAVLGMSGYAVRSMTPEEYAQWVTQADPEAIMKGAEQAAMLSSNTGDGSISRSTRLAGGTLGLFASYSDSVDTEDKDLFEALEAGDK